MNLSRHSVIKALAGTIIRGNEYGIRYDPDQVRWARKWYEHYWMSDSSERHALNIVISEVGLPGDET